VLRRLLVQLFRPSRESPEARHEAAARLGILSFEAGRHAEARAFWEPVLPLKQDEHEPEEAYLKRLFSAAEMLQVWGDLRRRFEAGTHRTRSQRPLWDGRRKGRVLLNSPRGLGDAIHFARYAAYVAAAGASPLLECDSSLLRLFASLPGEVKLLPEASPLPPHDFQCPLECLMDHYFLASLNGPPSQAYLHADPGRVAQWSQRLGPRRGLRVGLCWAGNPGHANDARRSMHLRALQVLASVAGIEFFSLQKGAPSAHVGEVPGLALRDFTSDLHDFADTADLVAQLDLVISVNTSVAHLSGALGKETWLLLAQPPEDRRWLVCGRPSRIYGRAALFTQAHPGDWAEVILRLRDALDERSRT
jgi:hypothetical protein